MSKIEYAWIFLGAAAIVAYYLYKSFEKEDRIGKSLRNMILCGLPAILSYLLTLTSNSYFVMSVGNSLVFMLIDWILFFFLQYTFYLSGNHKFPKKSEWLLIAALGVDNIMLAINPFYEVALTYRKKMVGTDCYLIFEKYPWFELHLLICYAMFLGAGTILIRKCIGSPKVYRKRYTTILLCMIIVIAVNGLFLAMGLAVDVSIILYSLLACVFYFYTFEFEPYGVIADARKFIFNQMKDPIVLFDNEDRFLVCNESAKKLFQMEEKMTLATFCRINPYLTPNQEKKEDILEVMLDCDGITKWFQIQYQRLTDAKNRFTGTLLVYNEVPAQKRAIRQLEYQVNHDPLTGLYNRNYVNHCRQEMMHTFPMPISIGIFNINGLRLVNDFYGLDKGDQVLCTVASILKEEAREGDRVARMDGDEMLIFLPGTDIAEAEEIFARIGKRINNKQACEIQISVEYGQSVIYSAQDDTQKALEEARKEMVQKKLLNKESVRSSILESLKKSLLESDFETEQHVERTSRMSIELGKRLGIKKQELGQLGLLATLHDIGKVSIPERILHKEGKLTEEEWEIMKSHTVKGYEIAKITQEVRPIAKCILCHHERWDGNGYPYGLKGEQIPLLSRIIAIVDSHDVMTHDRPYHKAMTMEESIQELRRCAGTQFDPQIVEVFISMLEEKNTITQDHIK